MNKDEKKRHLILTDPNIYKGIIILALPLMLNNLIKTLQSVIDMYFVGDIPYYSTQAISAISLTFPVNSTFTALGMGLSAAGTAFMSQLIGAGRRSDVKKYAGNLLLIAFILGLILNFTSYQLSPSIMYLMGTRDYVLEQSAIYLQIRSFELPFVFMFFAFVSIRQSSGDTVTAVIYGVITIIINIVLSPVLISTFNMGVSGAAYATLIANVVIVPPMLYKLFFSKDGIKIDLNDLKPDIEVISETASKAIPASIGQAITSIGFIIMNAMIVSYGDQTVAAFSVGNRINSLVLMPVMAMGGILSAYIGQNIGHGQSERAKDAVKKTFIMGIGIMIIGAPLLMVLRRPLINLFLDGDPEAADQAYTYMIFVISTLPLMAIFQTFIGAFNGTGNTLYTFIITVTRLWVLRIPLILILGTYTDLGQISIWTSMLLSNLLITIPGIIMYRKIDFKPLIKRGKKDEFEEQPRSV